MERERHGTEWKSESETSAAVHNITALLGEVCHDLLVAAIVSFRVSEEVGVFVEVEEVGFVEVLHRDVAKHATCLCIRDPIPVSDPPNVLQGHGQSVYGADFARLRAWGRSVSGGRGGGRG